MDITRRRNLTAATPSPLLRYSNNFEDFGSFDEEECRFFLREVGERVVPVYPFSFGMEEVYSLILERYGYAGLPDATSVLQELLEDDGTAAGLGDDGDVWRSWRHNWRHRNNDTLNPFIPKVGSFILQPPTLPHIRKIRALNFIRESQERERRRDRVREAEAEDRRKRKARGKTSPSHKRVGSSANTINSKTPPSQKRIGSSANATNTKPQEPNDENLYLLPATTYSHQRTRTLLSSSHGSPISKHTNTPRPSTAKDSEASQRSPGSSEQEIDLSLLDPDIDPSLLITFGMRSPGGVSLEGSPSPALRGGQGEAVILQQVSSQSSPASDRHYTLPSSSPLPRITSSPLGIFLPGTPPSQSSRTQVTADAPMRSSRAISEPLRVIDKDDKLAPVEQDKSVERLRKPLENLKPFARRPTEDNSERSRRIRADNRQVRILDGMILNPRLCKKLSSPPRVAEAEMHDEEKKKSVVRRSLTPVWQKRDSSRGSWMETMRNFFRTEASSIQAAKQSKRESSNRSQPAVTPSILSSSNRSHDRLGTAERERPSHLSGLDGTTDSRPVFLGSFMSRLTGAMDRNKPLPLSPPGIVHSLSAHPGFPSSFQPRTDNLTQSNRARTSATLKEQLQGLTAHAIKRKEVPKKHQMLPVYQDFEDTSGHQAEEPTKMSQSPLPAVNYSRRCDENQNTYADPYVNPFVNDGSAVNLATQAEPPLSAITYSSIANRNPFISNPNSPNSVLPVGTSPDSRFAIPVGTSGLQYGVSSNRQENATTQDPFTSNRNNMSPVFPAGISTRSRLATQGGITNLRAGASSNLQENTALSTRQETQTLHAPPPASEPERPKIHWRDSTLNPNADSWTPAKKPASQRVSRLGEFLRNTFSGRPRAAVLPRPRPLVVSVDPGRQAYILGTLESTLLTSVNTFLLHSEYTSRLNAEEVRRVAAKWQADGHPVVVGFLYDARTQRELVLRNLSAVRFRDHQASGRHARAMAAWSALVAVLSAPRVLCLADDVLLEHVAAFPEVLRMLRASEAVVAGFAALCLEQEVLVRVAVKSGEEAIAAV